MRQPGIEAPWPASCEPGPVLFNAAAAGYSRRNRQLGPAASENRQMITPVSERIRFEVFEDGDAPALAALLADTSITRNITTNGSTPERCLASARRRIAWHNSYAEQQGYRVWALRARSPGLAPPDRLLGWCGFVPPDDDSPDPEILYAVDRDFRGIGIAGEAAAQAIAWLFGNTVHQGVSAVIFARLNPASVAVVSKLGFRLDGRMDFSLFLSSSELADEVAEYEIWRLRHGGADDLGRLVEETAFRAGQLSTVTSMSAREILHGLRGSLDARATGGAGGELRAVVERSFGLGAAEAYMDCYHLSRERWLREPGSPPNRGG